MSDWLEISRGEAPLVVAFPHTGELIPPEYEARFVSPWLARFDTDWQVDRLYGFAAALDATTVRTSISRAIIDVNRDPSGASLYPGQATTGLCPVTTFDGVPLYCEGMAPDQRDIDARRSRWFSPYHDALAAEIGRLRAKHGRVVLYDAHSIRSVVPRLFDADLPLFNVGTNGGTSCDAALREAITGIVSDSGETFAVDGRFRGGWTTRHYGRPHEGVHAVQMELAQRAYLREPEEFSEATWPAPFDSERAARSVQVLQAVLTACLYFASRQESAT